ncbi:MAG: Lrp/AsnC family transcriptional regulator [Desulfobacterales bacterium]|nr:Lrp/AsnC family transcriptional regulator [Desulfobacterales bacterium]
MDLTDEKRGRLLDEIGRRILMELRAEGRLSMRQLGLRVGLSTPAVTERVKKLEEAGILLGYHAKIRTAPKAITAFIHLRTPPQSYPAVQAVLAGFPQVMECHHMSGDDAFIIKVGVDDMARIEALVTLLSPHGTTRTSIVLSTPIPGETDPGGGAFNPW